MAIFLGPRGWLKGIGFRETCRDKANLLEDRDYLRYIVLINGVNP
jgi:hypothetical protein